MPTPQLIIAGLAGFIVGQTINAWVVVLIKERTKEKHLWARLVGSTFAGQLGDTLVFCSIAASAIGITTFREFAVYTALGWLYKTAVEVVHAARSPIASSRSSSAASPHISPSFEASIRLLWQGSQSTELLIATRR